MKIILLIAALILLNDTAVATSESHDTWTSLRKQVELLRFNLNRNGIYAIVTNAALPKTAPHIHSQCWVDWLPAEETERRAFEQEKREFGLDVLGQLEGFAMERTELMDACALRERTLRLIAIADWIKGSPGYGNFILKRWAEDLAISSLAQLAVDETCPLYEAKALLSRVDTHEDSARMQVAILNEESPDRWKTSPRMDANAIQRTLGVQWGKRMHEAKDRLSTLRIGKRQILFDDVKTADRRYAFYIPDVNPGDTTIRRCWNLKDHEEICVYGMCNRMRQDVGEILKCREALGGIPMPTATDLKDPASQERYIDRMDILWSQKVRGLGIKAFGRLIVQVRMGRFIDPYTRMQRMKQ